MSRSAISSSMATADPWTPSRRIRSAAAAERERVERELARLTERERRLAQEIDRIKTSRDVLQHELGVLERLAQTSGASRLTQPTKRRLQVVSEPQDTGDAANAVMLRGAQVRETAVRVLAAAGQVDQAVHYRTWFDLLRQRGFLPAGKDPLATFLTQIGRSPVVQRSTEPGVYSLDLGFPDRAASRLGRLQADLEETQALPNGATVEELAHARQQREKLQAEIQSLERLLTEARRSLGE
jgi:chromosome segregation ATPase